MITTLNSMKYCFFLITHLKFKSTITEADFFKQLKYEIDINKMGRFDEMPRIFYRL